MRQSLSLNAFGCLDFTLYVSVCCTLSFHPVSTSVFFFFLVCLYLSASPSLIVHLQFALLEHLRLLNAHFSFQNRLFQTFFSSKRKSSDSTQAAKSILSGQVKIAGGSMKARSNCNFANWMMKLWYCTATMLVDTGFWEYKTTGFVDNTIFAEKSTEE